MKQAAALIGLLVAGLVVYILQLHPSEATQYSGQRPSKLRRGAGGEGGGEETGLEGLLRRFMRGDPKAKPAVRNYVDRELLRTPVTAAGVSATARDYYRLTDKQVSEVAEVVKNARMDLLSVISNSVTVFTDPNNGATGLFFEGSEELYNKIREDVHDRLSAIVDAELADSGASVIDIDGAFLGGGRFDLFFFTVPPHGNAQHSGSGSSVRIEAREKDGTLAQAWTVPQSELGKEFMIEFDESSDLESGGGSGVSP